MHPIPVALSRLLRKTLLGRGVEARKARQSLHPTSRRDGGHLIHRKRAGSWQTVSYKLRHIVLLRS